MIEIYDIITKSYIQLPQGKIIEKSLELGIDYTNIYKLLEGKTGHIHGRFILREDNPKLFTLIDFDSSEEFVCITNRTIFLHLKCDYSDNISKYISDLKKGKQKLVSIANRVFYLKGRVPERKGQKTKAHSDKLNAMMLHQNLQRKIASKLRTRIYTALDGKRKLDKTEALLGCKFEFFLGYIEALFSQGMSWDNYGQWHVDHIRPCHSFELSSLEKQRECFHFKNLRPLWATSEIAQRYGEDNYIGNLNRKKV